MNAPPLLRSLRRAVQVQMPTARCAWQQVMRPAQMRFQSSIPAQTVPTLPQKSTPATTETDPLDELREPRGVQALYLKPLRRNCEYGVPTADLQLRSYSKRGLALFCDFSLRAAYYLGLPAFGPVPLPRIIERWTVPKSHFIYKKSQENFERITRRRLIQIRDGHPETVQVWLAFLKKHAYPGIGMKANVWEYESLDVAKGLDALAEESQELLKSQWDHIGEGKVPFKHRVWTDAAEQPHADVVERTKDELIKLRQKHSSGL